MRVLVVTDSLGLPRRVPEVCEYDEIWPVKLKKSGFIVHQLSIGGATVIELYKQMLSYHLEFKPDIIIFQSGIVDCAPRAFKKHEITLLKSTKPTKYLLNILSKKFTHFFRKHRNISYTNLSEFKEYLLKIKDLKGIKIYWVGITPVNSLYEKKVPGITQRVKQYNSVIKEIFNERFISIDDIPQEGLMSDHFHINSIGNNFIYSKIIQAINA